MNRQKVIPAEAALGIFNDDGEPFHPVAATIGIAACFIPTPVFDEDGAIAWLEDEVRNFRRNTHRQLHFGVLALQDLHYLMKHCEKKWGSDFRALVHEQRFESVLLPSLDKLHHRLYALKQ